MKIGLTQGKAGRRAKRALAFAALAFTVAASPVARAADSAVILMYHRFGEDTIASTNIRLEQFEAHIEELLTGGYTVLPVPEILAALRAGRELPERAVGITVDDGYASVYSEAWPRLVAAGFPFTVFVSTDAVDQRHRGMMSWDQIRALAEAGVTIGHHSATHGHMAYADPVTSAIDINKASARFADELGRVPEIFAYPFGEYSRELRELVIAAGFTAAFGQQSGAVFAGADPYGLPRFALNEQYGDLDRFRLVANTLPLPTSDVTPSDPLLGPNPPPFGFTVAEGVNDLDRLNCYASGQGATAVERLGSRRIEVRVDAPFPPGRARINCTLPGPEGRWRWFGMQFLIPQG